MRIHFLNLTNGLEDYEKGKEFHFLRLQSTACEQKRWNEILLDIPSDLYMHLAIGNICIIHDYSARKLKSRALFQGIEFLKFVLNKIWFNREEIPYVRNCNVFKYFKQEYEKLDKKTIHKLEYYKKFLFIDKLNIELIYGNTKNDGNIEYFKKRINKEEER